MSEHTSQPTSLSFAAADGAAEIPVHTGSEEVAAPSPLKREPLEASRNERRLEMRKIVFGGANSLDNYLARPDHAVDWLMWGDEAAAVMADFWTTIDTVLMGRKTFEVAARGGQASGYPGVETSSSRVHSRRSPAEA